MSLRLDRGIENELRSIEGNNICVDCAEKNPQWASVSFGVFMCLECSGRHRALGVHISFVRSVAMDSWNEKQIHMMRLGGNAKCNAFLQQYGVAKNTPIAQKYNTPAAQHYREVLHCLVGGKPAPPALSMAAATAPAAAGHGGNRQGGSLGGSDPLPGETEEAYVRRQRQIQEEARERMRQKFGSSNGLRGGGSMQGIGSDPNYDPSQAAAAGGLLDTVTSLLPLPPKEEITAQLGQASQAAASLFSSVWETTTKTVQDAGIADTVKSGWGSLSATVSSVVQPIGGGSAAPPSSDSYNYNYNFNSGNAAPHQYMSQSQQAQAKAQQDASSGWGGALSSLWSQASTVTSNLVAAVVNEPSEEESRFPRPPAYADSAARGPSTTSTSSSSTSSSSNSAYTGMGSSGNIGSYSTGSTSNNNTSSTSSSGSYGAFTTAPSSSSSRSTTSSNSNSYSSNSGMSNQGSGASLLDLDLLSGSGGGGSSGSNMYHSSNNAMQPQSSMYGQAQQPIGMSMGGGGYASTGMGMGGQYAQQQQQPMMQSQYQQQQSQSMYPPSAPMGASAPMMGMSGGYGSGSYGNNNAYASSTSASTSAARPAPNSGAKQEADFFASFGVN